MTAAASALDARAMRLLGDLLDTEPAQADALLESLRSTDPALHARLQALREAAQSADSSLAIAAPLARGLGSLGAPGPAPGDMVAGYRLISELGRGGMATVWRAERADGNLKRPAAIKLPLAAQLSAVLAERFARERDLLAALDHPNIAHLYDAGVAANGRPYIAMELVEGRPITEYAQARALPCRARLALFRQVLGAVHHAHQRMVVHRDLKPSNIFVDAQGQVKLLDFGIAKLLVPSADAPELTQEAGAVLTPRYAAPEQVLGQPITTGTDVYAAGVVLYELLTGRLPYAPAAQGVAAVTHALVHDAPAPAGLGRDIDTVLAKALAKAPADRYASAERLDEDLRRVLCDEPILARRVPWWQRCRLWVRRQPRLSAAGALAAAVLVATATFAGYQRAASQEQAARAAAVRDFMFQMVSDAEADESRPDGEVTGAQMLDAAVTRARGEFTDRPLLQGELLGELGRVYMRLGKTDRAIATLAEAIALLQGQGRPDEPALGKARAHLASLKVDNDGAGAEALAAESLAGCVAPGVECGKARYYAHNALLLLHSQRGRDDTARVHARAAVAESTAAFGPADSNTALAWHALATLARNEGDLAEAEAAIGHALALTQGTVLRAATRRQLALTAALLEMDLGRYGAARSAFEALTLQAAEAWETGLQLRLLGTVLLEMGRPDDALQPLARASQLTAETGDGFEAGLVAALQGRAQARLGAFDSAQEFLGRAREAFQDLGEQAGSQPHLQMARYAAELQLRRGQPEAAAAILSSVGADALARAPALERAHWHDLRGCVARAGGRWAVALDEHRQAGRLLDGVFAQDHPWKRRNALYAAWAEAASHPSPAALPAVQAAAARWADSFPAPSAWHAELARQPPPSVL